MRKEFVSCSRFLLISGDLYCNTCIPYSLSPVRQTDTCKTHVRIRNMFQYHICYFYSINTMIMTKNYNKEDEKTEYLKQIGTPQQLQADHLSQLSQPGNAYNNNNTNNNNTNNNKGHCART